MVTVRVVDLLEFVDIEHEQRQGLSIVPRAADLAFEPLLEIETVRHAGEVIHPRGVPARIEEGGVLEHGG